jgi:hypothetical protein
MESEGNKCLTSPSPDSDVNLTPHLNEEVLRHIATFLDFQSLRRFRLVSRAWHAVGLSILMKRGYYNLIHLCDDNDKRADLYRGAINYSSWKISHSVYESVELLHDDEMWGNVRSLSIHQKTPLSREFHRWAWKIIENCCHNLQQITLSFEIDADYLKVDSEVASDYEQAIQGHSNASFPKISNLASLTSVTFKGIHGKTTAYFAQHLLEATTANLCHLYFCPIGLSILSRRQDGEAFRIFDYLTRNTALLSNLQCFAFNLGTGRNARTENNYDCVGHCILSKESSFTIFMKEKASLPFQFSQNLTSLFWDCPFHLADQLLPGVLTPSIASSLVQLSFKCGLDSMGRTDAEGYFHNYAQSPIKISFPDFPRLRALTLGLFAGRSLSVPELIDSAPNLTILEARGPTTTSSYLNDMRSFWRGAEEGSVPSPKHHLQLRIFCTNIPCKDGLSTLQKISSKFPHLVELRLGIVRDVGLDSFLSFVQSHHPELERLCWTFEDEVSLPELHQHLFRVPGTLPRLTNYSLRYANGVDSIGSSLEDFQQLANSISSLLPSSSDQKPSFSCCLLMCLLLKFVNCGCVCGEPEEERSVRNGCKQCYLREFVRKHNLLICWNTLYPVYSFLHFSSRSLIIA